jgi:hypothetical protein
VTRTAFHDHFSGHAADYRSFGYLRTWSATKQFLKAHGFDPVDRLAHDFAAAWGDADARPVRWALSVRAGRIH